MTIEENLKHVKATLPETVELVAVSKYHTVEDIKLCYEAGQRVFGESREQELRVKREALPEDIEWHFIGHLQINKVKYIAPYISLIHAVDTPQLLREINRQGVRCGRRIRCLLQIHVAAEETKYGFLPEECLEYLDTGEFRELTNAQICGVMCMATNTDDEERIRSDFRRAHEFFDTLKQDFFPSSPDFRLRSYGMSHDYRMAVEEGANIVRIGSAIFE